MLEAIFLFEEQNRSIVLNWSVELLSSMVVNSRESVIAATVKQYARRAPLGEMSELDRSCYFAIGVFRSSPRERGETVRPAKEFTVKE